MLFADVEASVFYCENENVNKGGIKQPSVRNITLYFTAGLTHSSLSAEALPSLFFLSKVKMRDQISFSVIYIGTRAYTFRIIQILGCL